MTVLLLAACGKALDTSSAASSSAPESPAAAVGPTSTRPPVTVPGLEPSSVAPTRTLIPIRPVPHSSTATTTAHTTASTTASTPVPTTVSTEAGSAHSTTSSPSSTASTTTNSSSSSSSSSSDPTSSTTRTPTTSTSTKHATSGLSGRVVAIDPGHNGDNGEHPEIINKLIDGGYGQRNVCNTTGTETDAGYTEHEFTWHVASYLRPMLEAKGITVVMTRFNDTGVGPCTDKRAAIENNADADAVVSIHGDGAPPEVRGFYVLTATRPPAGPTIAAASLRLAACIAKAAIDAGFPPSNTLGSGGLWKRDDLTGLNRSTRPKILIECGNMRNATEAALMSSTDGQRRYAEALAQGVFAFLTG